MIFFIISSSYKINTATEVNSSSKSARNILKDQPVKMLHNSKNAIKLLKLENARHQLLQDHVASKNKDALSLAKPKTSTQTLLTRMVNIKTIMILF